MNRKWIYYTLTMIMGCAAIGGNLNSQLILVGRNEPWSNITGWEIIYGGFGSLIYTLGCIFLGFLSDRLGRMPCIALSCLISVVLNCIMGFKILGNYQLWHFFFYWFIMNLVFAVFFTSIEGLLSDYQDHRVPLAKRLGAYCISWCLGDAIFSIVTGALKQATGSGQLLYKIIAVVCLGAFATTVFDWYIHGYKKLGDTDIGDADIRPNAPFHAKIGRIGLFFTSLAFAASVYSFPRFGRDYHLFSEAYIGNFVGLLLFSSSITFILFPRWKGWHYKPDLQIILQTPIMLGLLLLIFAPKHSIAFLSIGFILFGFGYAIGYFFSLYYSLMVPKDHSKSGGIHEAFVGLGCLFGPIISVFMIWLIGKTGYISTDRIAVIAIYVSLIGILLSISIQILLVNKEKMKYIQR